MPKMKTHKGVKKRFRISAKGKVSHKRSFSGHLMSGKSGRRRRHLRKHEQILPVMAKKILRSQSA